ncbi:MAG: hypothetical protein AMJ53_00525 [Gammaproteobacteria bacterium SG8_11]|nr:MAG: hypothetical protein AMJ53_00525 [Gammaproteobacteria bacterium SG8_11]
MQYSYFLKFAILTVVFSLFACAGLEKHIQTPTVKYAGSRVNNATLYDANVDFLIHVDNPNPIGLTVQGLNYNLDINNKKLLSGSAQPGTEVPAREGVDLSVPVLIRYEDILDGLQELLQKDTLDYALKGEIDLGFFKLPYSTSGTIPLPQLPQIQLKAINIKRLAFDGVETVMQFSIDNNNDFALSASGLSYELLLNNIATVTGANTTAIDVPPQSDGTFEIISKFSLQQLSKVLDTFRKGDSVNAELNGQLEIPVTDKQNKQIPFSWSGETAIFR